MSTPQDPGGDTPQEPQNPYGTPPPPAAGDPAAPPPPSDPAAPPPYGDPVPPPPAYGQPSYPQPGPTGQPSYPQYAPAGGGEPGKGMAIGALIASILGCTCVGILVAVPLAIVVLVRSRDGRNHGKGLAIAALVISAISVIGLGAGGYALYDWGKDLKSVDDLAVGDCITADELVDENATSVGTIRSVGCSAEHDAEVVGTGELTADQADSFTTLPSVDLCLEPATTAGNADLVNSPDLKVIALTVDSSPAAGDALACVVTNADGSKLSSKLGS